MIKYKILSFQIKSFFKMNSLEISFCLVFVLIPSLLKHFLAASSSSASCHLPNECQLVKPYEIHDRFEYTIKCDLDDSFRFDVDSVALSGDKMWQNCEILNRNKNKLFFFFLPKSPFSNLILSVKHLQHFENLKTYILNLFRHNNKTLLYSIRFHYVHGFKVIDLLRVAPQLSSSLSSIIKNSADTRVQFFRSNIEFFADDEQNRKPILTNIQPSYNALNADMFNVLLSLPAFQDAYIRENKRTEIWALIIINCVCDILNYPLFLFVCWYST
jgi:hypothetical protein